jgi:hypothetical protein
MSEAGAYLSSSTQLSRTHKDTVFVKQKEAGLQLTSSPTSIRSDLGDHRFSVVRWDILDASLVRDVQKTPLT